jgi:hypothetical protein
MRHPEIESTLDAKPTWKDMLIGILGVLALAGLLAWEPSTRKQHEIRIKHSN